jgi:hypothetical protein
MIGAGPLTGGQTSQPAQQNPLTASINRDISGARPPGHAGTPGYAPPTGAPGYAPPAGGGTILGTGGPNPNLRRWLIGNGLS